MDAQALDAKDFPTNEESEKGFAQAEANGETMDDSEETTNTVSVETSKPVVEFDKVDVKDLGIRKDFRRIPVPPHRMTPLRNTWETIVKAIVDHMKLQVRMNTKRKCVELRNSDATEDANAVQKAYDFVKAFMVGFEVQDAIAMLRLDDLYVETFEVKDVKNLHGEHLSRCIGRIAGEKGKTKNAIENATRTRIVLADSKIHLLGSFGNIKFARDAICNLILGSPPGKVYSHLRVVAKRYNERF